MEKVLTVLLFVAVNTGWGAFEINIPGGRSVSMGGTGAALDNSAWAAFCNPSTFASMEGRTLSVLYSPQRFGLRQLAYAAFSYIEPTRLGVFGLSGSRFGFELYREVSLMLTYGNVISGLGRFGINFRYYSLSIENYGSDGTFGADVGLLVDVSEEVQWGFSATNLNTPTLGETKDKLPQVYTTGVSYRPIPTATLAIDIVKDIRFPAELHVGIEYAILDLVDLRGGASSDPSAVHAGIGLHYSFLNLDYAFSSHPDLGISHLVSMSILFAELVE